MSGGRGAPSGRCLRSGHKNSVKGKGAIKHKGAPTIIYHCTDAPFRFAPLATHPLSGGGQEKWRRGTVNSNPCLPPLAGGGGPRLYLKSCLPPLAGGRGTAFPKTCLPPLAGGGGPRSGGGGLLRRGAAPAVNCYYLYAAEFPLTFSLLFRRPLWTGNT